jgi:predicted small lipoprotein YifL
MRVISRMRAAAPDTTDTTKCGLARRGAILAVSAVVAVGAVGALTGCGQRGPLYMPTVPPLPAKPNFETQDNGTAAANAASAASGVEAGSVPDMSGTPLSLSPDTELSTTPAAPGSQQPASGATPTQ